MSYRRLRMPLLVAHIASSVGFLGAVAVFFCLAVSGLVASDGRLVNASYAVMPQITWFVIVPLAAVSLAVGVLQSLLSPWGLIRHYWVVVKFAMTVLITFVLMLQTNMIDGLGASASARELGVMHLSARYSVLLHSGVGMLALLVVLVLSVVKPKGTTGWGRIH
ncbi:hypothetical protein IHQ71_16485 [Rhizobium sp. TH2]|uniref:hypothetical protein n=1 Tax=Rhizobium sp. TH2 TaxID=2775403 RepID=UPI0021586F39|nr:hypothetical protein [Rhizobium sp. TH2]UVC06847.1 hypothetical protein IHQ71_16485 [Rhizobium sp. TH2]